MRVRIVGRMSHKDLKKHCDKLWAELIKKRAGYKSELSGQKDNLVAHHLLHKPNYRLRYALENGLCITKGEHFNFHYHPEFAERHYTPRIRAKRGADIFEKLESMKRSLWKVSLVEVRLSLEAGVVQGTNPVTPSTPGRRAI